MKKIFFALATSIIFATANAQLTKPLFVDSQGILRNTETGKEVSYFGTNYTLPFAHSFRAANYLGVNKKTMIDIDVYHMCRMGINAFRLHLWDVEISDAKGNLLQNEHLELLDYLIMKLEQRGIDIILTAQTNFGNGYPEKDINTGAYSYIYNKCEVHQNDSAIEAQKNYIAQLVKHVNKYTGKSYKDDKGIVAIEINNEPCHTASSQEVTQYINEMIDVIRQAGCKKVLLYNVTHNRPLVDAYFNSNIDATTYQWYPTGLVAGYEKKSNYLPHVDNYPIDFKNIDGFNKKAKLVYEFDPADILQTYLYPAVERSFRSAGFQWATQFAYDAMFLAPYNTDYQTHYLNLIYTPGKAVGMKIAAEVAQKVPLYQQFEPYPDDTAFFGTKVSYRQNLAVFNADNKFFYTNNTTEKPENAYTLKEICGVGSSPIVKYEGTGVYFLDKVDNGVWRLEVMPDVVMLGDPFERPSLNKRIALAQENRRKMTIFLPDLGGDFKIERLSFCAPPENNGNTITISPGTYLLKNSSLKEKKKKNNNEKFKPFKNISINEFYAPTDKIDKIYCYHIPPKIGQTNKPLLVEATIVGPNPIDSVIVYNAQTDFWTPKRTYKMQVDNYNKYTCFVDTCDLYKGTFGYYITIFSNGQATTFPSKTQGNPMDWDFVAKDNETYNVVIDNPQDNIVLIRTACEDKKLNINSIPNWNHLHVTIAQNMPYDCNALWIAAKSTKDSTNYILYKSIEDEIAPRIETAKKAQKIYLKFAKESDSATFTLSIVTKDGITFSASKKLLPNNQILCYDFSEFEQSPTIFTNSPFPIMKNNFIAKKTYNFNFSDAESIIISTEKTTKAIQFGFIGCWIE